VLDTSLSRQRMIRSSQSRAGGHLVPAIQLGVPYQGIYRDGIVRLDGDVDLRNGSRVEVNVVRKARKSPAAKPAARARASKAKSKRPLSGWDRAVATANKMTNRERNASIMAFCGVWKDRPDWKGKSSARIAAELRKRASSRGRHD